VIGLMVVKESIGERDLEAGVGRVTAAEWSPRLDWQARGWRVILGIKPRHFQ
jgi:hypothetical protein